MEPDQVDLVAYYADMLQIGTRNMANFPLLRRVGQIDKPVLLKRGFSATIEEWLMSAEYILAQRQPQRRPLRARHPRLRPRDPVHPRSHRDAVDQRALAFADHRRSQPRHRTSLPGSAHVSRRAGRGCGRSHRRGTPRPGQGQVRRAQTINPVRAGVHYGTGLKLHSCFNADGLEPSLERSTDDLCLAGLRGTMERWEFRIVDVFTDRPLAGNQLAVFENAVRHSGCRFSSRWRRKSATRKRCSSIAPPGADARMRIFTPEAEINFAGHPTLGTAVLTGARLGKDRVVLQTGMGPVPVRLEANGRLGHTRHHGATDSNQRPLPCRRRSPACGRCADSTLPVTLYDNGIPHVYVTLASPAEVAALNPDLAALTRLARGTSLPTVGFNVFAGSGQEWKTRMFAPADGVPEDAATGSAAGPLALHLARHGVIPWGSEIRIVQGVEIGRPSELFARVSGSDDQVERIEVSGYAVPVGGGWFDGDLLTKPGYRLERSPEGALVRLR